MRIRPRPEHPSIPSQEVRQCAAHQAGPYGGRASENATACGAAETAPLPRPGSASVARRPLPRHRVRRRTAGGAASVLRRRMSVRRHVRASPRPAGHPCPVLPGLPRPDPAPSHSRGTTGARAARVARAAQERGNRRGRGSGGPVAARLPSHARAAQGSRAAGGPARPRGASGAVRGRRGTGCPLLSRLGDGAGRRGSRPWEGQTVPSKRGARSARRLVPSDRESGSRSTWRRENRSPCRSSGEMPSRLRGGRARDAGRGSPKRGASTRPPFPASALPGISGPAGNAGGRAWPDPGAPRARQGTPGGRHRSGPPSRTAPPSGSLFRPPPPLPSKKASDILPGAGGEPSRCGSGSGSGDSERERCEDDPADAGRSVSPPAGGSHCACCGGCACHPCHGGPRPGGGQGCPSGTETGTGGQPGGSHCGGGCPGRKGGIPCPGGGGSHPWGG
ncbi:hypothetical protein DFJ74DRAFT_696396 [Hyaloraphidium curvatum]|nr:hypothetical protein DFJ74DRAFT_696396 [Hyaloraphidium curvatum]